MPIKAVCICSGVNLIFRNKGVTYEAFVKEMQVVATPAAITMLIVSISKKEKNVTKHLSNLMTK